MAETTSREPHLTARQREILERIARGRTNAEIAEELGIGFETVKMHVSHTLAQLGVSSREEAAEWWRRQRRPVARLVGLLPGLSIGRLIAGGAAVVAIGVAGAVGIALAGSGGSQGETEVLDVPIVEPVASYPVPNECNSDLVAAVFNQFFAAWNRGDAQAMFELVNDPRGVWFDLGYDPLAFVSSGGVREIHVRTLDDFQELVTRYAGMHWAFYGQPAGNLVTTAPNAPQAVDAAPNWRLTGPALTAVGKTMAFGSGKFGVYCDTHKLFGVMGRPTVQ